MVVAIVTTHAAARVTERDEGLAGCRNVRGLISGEVVAALAAGRVSKRCPMWVRRQWIEGAPAADRAGVTRFVWDEAERRCYVVKRMHRRDDVTGRIPAGGVGWIVLTALVAGIGAIDGVTVRRRVSFARR